jgi:hypothetical protein
VQANRGRHSQAGVGPILEFTIKIILPDLGGYAGNQDIVITGVQQHQGWTFLYPPASEKGKPMRITVP